MVSSNAIYGHLTSTSDLVTDSSAGIRIRGSQDWTIKNNVIEDNIWEIYTYATSSGITFGAKKSSVIMRKALSLKAVGLVQCQPLSAMSAMT